MQVELDKIAKVYSGRTGCMCGCRGKYSYNEGVPHEAWQGAVNVRSVKMIAKRVLSSPNVVFEGDCAYEEESGRMRVVYFK